MDELNPGPYEKVGEALKNPFIRVGSVHRIQLVSDLRTARL